MDCCLEVLPNCSIGSSGISGFIYSSASHKEVPSVGPLLISAEVAF